MVILGGGHAGRRAQSAVFPFRPQSAGIPSGFICEALICIHPRELICTDLGDHTSASSASTFSEFIRALICADLRGPLVHE